MRVLQKGATGEDVRQWQSFLYGAGYREIVINNCFDDVTETATRNYQMSVGLKADGAVGQKTYGTAIQRGFPLIVPSAYPPKPNFSTPSVHRIREMFGDFRYRILRGGNIEILEEWATKNIIKIHIPQLVSIADEIEGEPSDGYVWFHRKGAEQLKSLFAAWEAEGLLKYLESWGGSFVPRMIRGSRTSLSNHAWGTAFDINAAWNGLGRVPAAADKTGTVIPLVPLANAHGFFWGGHYNSRLDGMHFELAVIGKFPSKITGVSTPVNKPGPAVEPPAQSTAGIPSTEAGNGAAASQTEHSAPTTLPSVQGPPPDNSSSGTDAAPGWSVSVEDLKPFVKRNLARAWKSFGGINAAQFPTLTGIGAFTGGRYWWIGIAAAAVLFLFSLAAVLLVSGIFLLILFWNRIEQVVFRWLVARSRSNPQLENIGLQIEKK